MLATAPRVNFITREEAAAELLRRRQARRSLEHFTTYTKPDYQVNWHHHVLCDYLDRFVASEIKRLIVSMPPRHGKSELVSRRLPAYILGRSPDVQIIACSYGADLAGMTNRDVQRIIDDRSYQALFPDTRLFGKNVRAEAQGNYLRNSDIFEIVNHRGFYRSAGVGGSITGLGFLYGIIDDPIKNREEADSKTYRDALWEWYTSTFYTRREKGAAILITLTRWHEDDLVGRLLKQAKEDPDADQWLVVRFPARAEEKPAMSEDRRVPGDPLWPDKFSDEDLRNTRATIGARDWYALHQQTPRPQEGRILDSNLLLRIDAVDVPPLVRIVRYWDLAFSESKGADYVTGAKVGIAKNGRRYILHMKRLRGRWTASRPIIVETALGDGVEVACFIEANGGQLGYYQDVHDNERMRSKRIVLPDRPEGSKEMRASVWGSRLADGIIYCVRGEWNEEFFDEMDAFPNGEHDDQVDAVSGAMHVLTDDIDQETIVYDEETRVDIGY
ncbi:MAG TPA: phage terminase large subunit [Anaerolineae bacterium]|nr:phage terminase large subunit [Anaerolineae bacterium]